ncbi:DUF2207 domain-containing protein [Luteimonas sp. BDR2-5]|uniref:DUF2207 domain-containing protein n=1 Tax=Proluteimonas luteida TaxID=2878685 RepID=UPI001E369FE5|nr:DUF2207 domain-containing protein [Luteimonas sp. BDR2-5]MCD9028282.1 DUF2207 domain-containing protein [Luteimonas sp. BDR2-5]
MRRLLPRLLPAVLLVLAFAAPAAHAEERILAQDIDIRVLADGRLDITERIHVRAEGRQIRRGITRDFPTRYRDRAGNRVTADFEVVEVLRDGEREPWQTRRMANGVRVDVGDERFLPLPSQPVYTLRYRTSRQLGFFADHDELYFNAIGLDGAFPVERASVRVELPAPVPVEAMRAEAYTGPYGAEGRAYRIALSASGSARWTLTRPLQPREGLTVVLAFPKGLVTAPTRQQQLGWLLRDNLGLLVAVAGLLLLLGYCVLRWRKLGRDPAAGTIVVRYDPPPGFSPAGLRYMKRMRYDDRCFSADLLACAVDDHVHIRRDKQGKATVWQVQRTRAGANTLPTMEQRALLTTLLPDADDALTLDAEQATRVREARQAHADALRRRFQPAMFRVNGGSVLIALGIALLTGGSAIVLAIIGGGLPLTVAAVALMLPVLIVFAVLVKAPTLEGRRLLDEIEGLRRYLGVAEKQDLKRLQAPGTVPALDATRYEFLLPYAVALDVEDAWTKKFTAAVGAAAAATAVAGFPWYAGIPVTDMGRFSRSMGNSLTTRIAASSIPPGSSSGLSGGGGGGGFSGGGGGGGGVGGR